MIGNLSSAKNTPVKASRIFLNRGQLFFRYIVKVLIGSKGMKSLAEIKEEFSSVNILPFGLTRF